MINSRENLFLLKISALLKTRKNLMMFFSVLLGVLMYPTVLFGVKLPDLGIFAWVHLVPLLLLLRRKNTREQCLISLIVFTLSYLGNLYWLFVAMRQYGGLNGFESMIVLVVLMLFLAAFKTLFFCMALRVCEWGRISLVLIMPFFMTLHDFAIHQFPFGGFPWILPAYSQGQWLMFFQWVSLSGAFGLSFFIILINALLAEGWMYFSLSSGIDKSVARFFLVFVVGLLSLYASSMASQNFEKNQKPMGEIRIGLIQANISQDQKWSRENLRNNLRLHQDLTFSALQDGAELVLWPESAYPYRLLQEELQDEKFLDYAELAAPLFVGAVISSGKDEHEILYNSVVHIDQSAHFIGQYNKMHLVPFGEYVPLQKWLTFVDNLTKAVGTFSPGNEPVLFFVQNIAFGSLICYEDVFLDIARNFAKRGADVLVNYTNDAWYENTSAQYQHLVMSQFRALENRKPLLRVTNTGYTAVINARGFVIDELVPFETSYLVHRLQVIGQESFFTRHGLVWMLPVEIIAVLSLVYAYIRHKLRSHKIR